MPQGKIGCHGSVSRSLFDDFDNLTGGIIVGKPVRSEEHGDRAVGIFVDADRDLDEVRSERALRQLETEAAPFHGIVVADDALFLDAENLGPGTGPIPHEA